MEEKDNPWFRDLRAGHVSGSERGVEWQCRCSHTRSTSEGVHVWIVPWSVRVQATRLRQCYLHRSVSGQATWNIPTTGLSERCTDRQTHTHTPV
jgi:hypothetical protein